MQRLILRSQIDRDKACSAVVGASLDPPTEVIIQPYVRRRSRAAVNRHWALMRMIEAQKKDEDGNLHSAEVWHIHLCAEFVGCDIVKMGNVDRFVPRPSPTGSAEFAEFADQCEAWAVGCGVTVVYETDQCAAQ